LVVIEDSAIWGAVLATDDEIVAETPGDVVEQGEEGGLEGVEFAEQPEQDNQLRNGVDETELEVIEVDADVLAAQTLVQQVGRVGGCY